MLWPDYHPLRLVRLYARCSRLYDTKTLHKAAYYVFVYGSNHRLFWTTSYVLSRHESGLLRVYYFLLM